MPLPGDAKTDTARRELLEEPTLYEAEHAASAFGLLLASPEPQDGLSGLPLPQGTSPTTPPSPLEPPSARLPPSLDHAPWEEATRVPPIEHQQTQAIFQVQHPHVQHPQIEHALPAGAVTEVRMLPSLPPAPSHRQRLLYPFVVGTLGGMLGLLIAMGGLQLVKQRREAQRRERLEVLPLQQQVMDRALRALLLGQRDEARELLQYYQLRWPSPGLGQLLQSLDRQEPPRPQPPR